MRAAVGIDCFSGSDWWEWTRFVWDRALLEIFLFGVDWIVENAGD